MKRCDHPRVGQQGAVKMPPPTAPPFQAPRPCFLLHHPWTFSEWSLKAHLFSVLQPTRTDIHLPQHPGTAKGSSRTKQARNRSLNTWLSFFQHGPNSLTCLSQGSGGRKKQGIEERVLEGLGGRPLGQGHESRS